MKTGKGRIKDFFSEVIFIALLTAISYWFAFLYEVGYLGAFGISPQLIQVKMETILISGFAISGSMFSLFLWANLAAFFWPNQPVLKVKAFRIGLILLLPVWDLINYGIREESWIIFVIALGAILVFEFIWPLVIFRGKKSLIGKFTADENAEASTRERSLVGRVAALLGPTMYTVLFVIIMSSMLVHYAGRADAKTQEEYMVRIDQPNIAIIRIYPDVIIGMYFDRKTKEIQPHMVLQKIGDEGINVLIGEKIGPLKLKASVKPKKSSKPKIKSD